MVESPRKILIVDDNPLIRDVLRVSLDQDPYVTIEAATGKDALRLFAADQPDLVLLDLGLPDMEGVEVVRRIRISSSTPIIIVSARAHEKSKVEALDSGADDYLTKPFGIQEMLARVRSALRSSLSATSDTTVFESKKFKMDLGARKVYSQDVEVHLTPREYKLLLVLVQNAGRLMTHGQLLEQVWSTSHADDSHYLRVYIRQLRQKLELDPDRPRLILNEPGVGYRLTTD